MQLQVVIFLSASLGLAYLSRASLRAPRSHGFYRFFAWEAILALIVLNAPVWFVDPFAPHQLVAWSLLVVSLVAVILGARALRAHGRPDPARQDEAPLLGMEKTTVLVTSGIYRYIRHPLYSSLLFLGWGAFFKDTSWLGGLLAAAATVLLLMTAKVEEAENLRYFGAAYQDYIKSTRMFIPFVL